jgi:hypothetical protein
MENWIPVIELVAIFLLFMISACITVSRLTLPLPKVSKETGVTRMDILRENDLTAVSIITTLFYTALLGHLAANFFTA